MLYFCWKIWRLYGICGHRRWDTVIEDVNEIGCKDVNSTQLAQDRLQWRAVMFYILSCSVLAFLQVAITLMNLNSVTSICFQLMFGYSQVSAVNYKNNIVAKCNCASYLHFHSDRSFWRHERPFVNLDSFFHYLVNFKPYGIQSFLSSY
jgi:hypothetical protein